MTGDVEDAFNSKLRTDYVPLRDIEKLNRLAEYYVDYYGFLNQILSENDQLIVGRRGTGKTTLLYRALVECMRSWDSGVKTAAKPRTLAIYVDLNKCQSLTEIDAEEFNEFEHVFVSELCDAITEEIGRSWPAVNVSPGFFKQLFKSAEQKKAAETKKLLRELAGILQSGLPRIVDHSGRVEKRDVTKTKQESEGAGSLRLSESPSIGASAKIRSEAANEQEEKAGYSISFRLTVADIVRI